MHEPILVATDPVPAAPAPTIASASGASTGSPAPITVTHTEGFDDVDLTDLERTGLDTARRTHQPHTRRRTSAAEHAIHPSGPRRPAARPVTMR